MVTALAKAATLLGSKVHRDAAEAALAFIWDELRQKDGRLCRSWKDGHLGQPGFLEDYAFVCQALLDTYEATFNTEYLQRVTELLQVCIDRLWDHAHGGFFMAEANADLVYRAKDAQDQSIPAGNGTAAHVLLRLHSYDPNQGYLNMAEKLFSVFARDMARNPWRTATLIGALDLYHAGMAEIVLVAPTQGDLAPFLQVVNSMYLPNPTVYATTLADSEQHKPALCRDKPLVHNQATAYVCRNFSCLPPVTAPDALRKQLLDLWRPALA